MSYYVGPALILLFATAEASVLPMFRVGGLQPNLTLVLMVAWLMVRGSREAFVLIPVAGVMLGLVDSAPIGTALLAMAPVALLHEIRGSQLREGGLMLTLLFTLLMTVIFNLVYLMVYTLEGASGPWLTAFTRTIIPTALLNAVVLLPIYAGLWMASGEMRRASYYA